MDSLMAMSLLLVAAWAAKGPCDILAAAGHECVAAHSTAVLSGATVFREESCTFFLFNHWARVALTPRGCKISFFFIKSLH